MVIDTGGNVGIGTTSPISPLHIKANTGLRIEDDGTTFAWEQQTISNGKLLFRHFPADIVHVAFTTGGNVGIGTTSPNAKLDVNGSIAVQGSVVHSSDARLKTEIKAIPDALEKVKQLRGVSYHWKDKELDTTSQLGLIGQEVEEVLPELVSTNRETGMKGVAYSQLIPVLIEAIKEQQRQIDELSARLNDRQ